MNVVVGFNLDIIMYVLFCHWIADFLFQNKWMINYKGKYTVTLLFHVFIYVLVVTTMLWWLIPSYYAAILFVFTVFVGHFTIDFLSVRIIEMLGKTKHKHLIYAAISFDQFACTVLLFATLIHLVNYFSP